MKKTEMHITGKDCVLYVQENAEYLLVQPVDEHDRALLDSEVDYIAGNTNKRFALAAFNIDDWNRALTPWEMPLLRGKGRFGSGASDTLDWMCRLLLPYCTERLGMVQGNARCLLGGYSLAGLFALWSGYQTDKFCGVAGVSPSVWYEGWLEFAAQSSLHAESVYLSLGTKEENAKHPVLAQIGHRIREYVHILADATSRRAMFWNGTKAAISAIRTRAPPKDFCGCCKTAAEKKSAVRMRRSLHFVL